MSNNNPHLGFHVDGFKDMTRDEQIVALDAAVNRLMSEAACMRAMVRWCVSAIATQSNVSEELIATWLVGSFLEDMRPQNVDKSYFQRIQERIQEILGRPPLGGTFGL